MSEAKIFAGNAVRRARRKAGLTQVAMADALDISPSYLNLIERNQRALSATMLVRLAQQFDLDPASLGKQADAGAALRGLRRRLSDPIFADLELDLADMEQQFAESPELASAFTRIFDRMEAAAPANPQATPGANLAEPQRVRMARQEIERWRNHFADLDMQAEALAEELRLVNPDIYGAIAERLRTRHQIAIRILPVDVMPGQLRRFDIHARQIQISEMLGPGSRTFQVAIMLAQIEARTEIDALVAGAGFANVDAERLYRRHLEQYFAAALIMPYARLLRACEATGYDLPLLQARFGVGFEPLAHRLTTLQRVGARGLPFFMLRIDRAGQASKRYAGASEAPLVESAAACPIWPIYEAFDAPDRTIAALSDLEDGSRWFTMAQMVRGPTPPMDAALSASGASAAPIGLGCGRCLRSDCVQRSAPPANRRLVMNPRERGISPFGFVGD
jgi:XRE family transcriptional regulator, fatty acid utilization regulator